MRPSRRLAAIVAAGLLVLPAACSGDDAPTSTKSSNALSGPVDQKAFVAGLLAAIDDETTVHLSVDAASMGSAEVDVAYGEDGTRTLVDAEDPQRGPGMFVIADGMVFIQQEVGGKFLKMDDTDPSYGKLISTYSAISPEDSVAGLAEGISDVVADGTDTVEGTACDHYLVTVDPTLASGAFKVLAGTSGVSQSVTFDFYVDSGQLLRKIAVKINGETTTVALNDWSKPVTIKVPSGADLVSS
ncbi:hypothetical protein ABIE44_001040 [Marmoricola sp. OAE513]|uniref:hypothetical protein n=1 Tax=Marmoricola sp. OAE513 TaxID=2817894 RepID=UPI001AE43DC7